MGNGQPRYYSNNEAIEIIGGDTWDRLRKQLERSRGNASITNNTITTIIILILLLLIKVKVLIMLYLIVYYIQDMKECHDYYQNAYTRHLLTILIVRLMSMISYHH